MPRFDVFSAFSGNQHSVGGTFPSRRYPGENRRIALSSDGRNVLTRRPRKRKQVVTPVLPHPTVEDYYEDEHHDNFSRYPEPLQARRRRRSPIPIFEREEHPSRLHEEFSDDATSSTSEMRSESASTVHNDTYLSGSDDQRGRTLDPIALRNIPERTRRVSPDRLPPLPTEAIHSQPILPQHLSSRRHHRGSSRHSGSYGTTAVRISFRRNTTTISDKSTQPSTHIQEANAYHAQHYDRGRNIDNDAGYTHKPRSGDTYYVIPAGINVIFQDEAGNEITRVGDFDDRRRSHRRRSSRSGPVIIQDEFGREIYRTGDEYSKYGGSRYSDRSYHHESQPSVIYFDPNEDQRHHHASSSGSSSTYRSHSPQREGTEPSTSSSSQGSESSYVFLDRHGHQIHHRSRPPNDSSHTGSHEFIENGVRKIYL